jgi:DNA-binding LytR/AlgR family response regulator
MNVLIIDDEAPAREELAWLLEQTGEDLTVVGQAANAREALSLLDTLEVDLAMCDVDMPGVDGLRLAELLSERDDAPLLVFVTAYERHAVDAFAVDAVDYLLKPVRIERLRKAIGRARERLTTPSAPAEGNAKHLQRISVEDQGVYRVLSVDDLLFLESEDGIVVAQTHDARYITDFSLKFLEANLDPERFFRSHRSYIVQLSEIDSIAPWGAGTYRLILDRDADLGVPLARSRASELKALIPWSASAFDD